MDVTGVGGGSEKIFEIDSENPLHLKNLLN
jgi:hypothetical protein